MSKRAYIFTGLICVVVIGGVLALGHIKTDLFARISPTSIGNLIQSDIQGGVTASSSPNALSSTDVITDTNYERTSRNIGALHENTELDAAAAVKLSDMFTQQYFEHTSPDGKGPSDLALDANYNFVLVGENLALGNFEDTQALVDAWMGSPGHRENILNARFVDIGVAVGEGTYQGKKVWIAVQEFGAPLSSCPIIDQSLKAKIETDRNATDTMNSDLTSDRDQINSLSYMTPEGLTAYNNLVASYNAEAAKYNALLAVLKAEIDAYNKEVNAFNACIAG